MEVSFKEYDLDFELINSLFGLKTLPEMLFTNFFFTYLVIRYLLFDTFWCWTLMGFLGTHAKAKLFFVFSLMNKKINILLSTTFERYQT